MQSSSGDTDSQPASASVSDQPTTPTDAWLDVDDSRWIDARDEAALNMWGSPMASAPPPPFDPASAFEPGSDGGGSDSASSGDSQRRQQANDAPHGLKRLRSSEEGQGAERPRQPSTTDASSPGSEVADDDERSSGDCEAGASRGDEAQHAAVLRALGPANVAELAAVRAGDLAALTLPGEGSDAGSGLSDGAESMSEPESEGRPGSPPPVVCTNCTFEYEATVALCPDCGHDSLDDARLFSRTPAPRQPRPQPATLLAYDERLLAHEEGKRSPHPERPDRVRAVIARLMSTGLADRCLRIPCREAAREELLACHTAALVDRVDALSEKAAAQAPLGCDRVYATPDTYVRPATARCARLAAGGCVEVATAVAQGRVAGGAAIVRPPGHHAESGMAMGFCFYNNAAVAARAAQRAGARRVMILDWDVHHGNGTQHIFEADPTVLYASVHRWDGGFFFPGTGGPHEVGRGPGAGFSLNVPWPGGGVGNGDYLAVFQHLLLPVAHEFAPDCIIVSAGFDAADGDPLGGCHVTPEGFAHMTAQLASVAPLALLLEGGYNLRATADGTEASLRVLLGERPPRLPCAARIHECLPSVIQRVVAHQAQYWRCLKPFVARLSFDPYTLDEPALLSPVRVRELGQGEQEASSPRVADALMPAVRSPGSQRQAEVSRALGRVKFAARCQGKSQRRLQYMHALHLLALQSKVHSSKVVSKRLAALPRVLPRLASGPHPLGASPRALAGSPPRAMSGSPRAFGGSPRAVSGSPRAFGGSPRAHASPGRRLSLSLSLKGSLDTKGLVAEAG